MSLTKHHKKSFLEAMKNFVAGEIKNNGNTSIQRLTAR
jgi:hypothetical protein